MDPVIRRLTLKGFRSFDAAVVDFDNPTFLAGPNGSGKSNLVDALAFLNEMASEPLQTIVERRGGLGRLLNRKVRTSESQFEVAVELGQVNGRNGSYSFTVRRRRGRGFLVAQERCRIVEATGEEHFFSRISAEGRDEDAFEFTTSEPWLKPAPEPSALLLPLIAHGLPQFAWVVQSLSSIQICSIDPTKLRQSQEALVTRHSRQDGGSTARTLLEIQLSSGDELKRIEDFLAAVLPYRLKVTSVFDEQRLNLHFNQVMDNGEIPLFADQMSDGTLRALGILAALFQLDSPSLIVVEEPEVSIHPHALGVLLDALQIASRRMQVVVTTHSPDVLDARWIEDRHLRLVTWDGTSRVAPISAASKEAIRQRLMSAGELLRANALEPADSVEPEPRATSARRE